LGLFIHWGPWSQSEIGAIWQIVKKDEPGVREKRFDLYRTFNPTEFDAAEWAAAARDAGMRYVVFTTKHHDGFCNFETKWTDYDIMNPLCPHSTSENPDITGQIVEAFRAEEMAIGHYYSHIDWYHPAGKYFSRRHWEFDEKMVDTDPELWNHFAEFEKGQVKELLTNYGDIDIMWFDIRWPKTSRTDPQVHHKVEHPIVMEDVEEMMQVMKDINPDLIVNDRGVDVYGDFATPEQKIPEVAPAGYWETNMTISDPNRRKAGGFWYKGPDAKYKTLDELLRVMAEVFSKGGNFLLNVGPQPDGIIPAGEVQRLQELGDWMDIYGEAVYGTKRSPLDEVPDWGFVTKKGNILYLYVFDWPVNGEKLELTIADEVSRAWLLDGNIEVPIERKPDGDGILLTLPESAPHQVASIIGIEL